VCQAAVGDLARFAPYILLVATSALVGQHHDVSIQLCIMQRREQLNHLPTVWFIFFRAINNS